MGHDQGQDETTEQYIQRLKNEGDQAKSEAEQLRIETYIGEQMGELKKEE